jgi:hypothetical protein
MSKQQRPLARRAAVGNTIPPVAHGSTSAQAEPARRRMSRGALFAILCATCLLVGIGYIAWAAVRRQAIVTAESQAPVAVAHADPAALAALSKQPHVLFRSTALGETFGRIALVPTDAHDNARALTPLECDRVYFAAGRGICLAGYQGDTAVYKAFIFDADFQTHATLPLNGIPSRTRISPDGRYGSITVFVSGHSYSNGAFSTQTTLIDLAAGTQISSLEQFAITRDGARFQAIDFNFWGVTFAKDSNRFYATLTSGGKTYLIEGDIKAQQAHVLYENVECPSLSPDNTRVAFKKAITRNGQPIWQITVLDLASLTERQLLAETRSVDDQVEWLDNQHLLYALPDDGPTPSVGENIWMLPTDGAGTPQLFLHKGFSPTVVQ